MNKIAFIYPGQGAQKAGMGKDFYAYSPLAAEIYDKASEILNIDMKALCFEENDLLDRIYTGGHGDNLSGYDGRSGRSRT